MGDKGIPARGPVGRMGDPWDEERMKLALQAILTQIEVAPIKSPDIAPILTPYWNSAQATAYWLVERLVASGVSAHWFEKYLVTYWGGPHVLLWGVPAD